MFRLNPAVEVSHVSKSFALDASRQSLRELMQGIVYGRPATRQRFDALDDVSFRVERGQAFGIIGANGSGKSTLLKLLSGIMPPTNGRILVRGRVSALIELGAGFHPELSGHDNIFLNGSLLGMQRQEIRQRFDSIVEFAGLAEFVGHPVKLYSSGMQLRLAFAVAAHVDPEVLLVDEVLAVGDAAFQAKCLCRINEMMAAGTTVVFVAHALDQVQELCHAACWLKRGVAMYIGDPHEVVERYLGSVAGEQEDDLQPAPPKVDGFHIIAPARVDYAADTTRPAMEVTIEGRALKRIEPFDVEVSIEDSDGTHLVADSAAQRIADWLPACSPGRFRLVASFGELPLAGDPGGRDYVIVGRVRSSNGQVIAQSQQAIAIHKNSMTQSRLDIHPSLRFNHSND